MLRSHDAAVAREQVLHITTHARVRSDGLRCVACVQTVQQYVEYNPRFVCSVRYCTKTHLIHTGHEIYSNCTYNVIDFASERWTAVLGTGDVS